MDKKSILIISLAVVVIGGVFLVPKYFEYRNSLKQEVEESLPVQQPISRNFSLPPPSTTTSTVIKTMKLPKPLSPQQQQEVSKKMTLPPPSTQ